MIFHIGTAPHSPLYKRSSFTEFVQWVHGLDRFQFDVETDMEERNKYKTIITYNIGTPTDQWVIEDTALAEEQRNFIYSLLEDTSRLKLIHYAFFEISLFRFRDVRIRNVWCTHLMEKVLFTGYEEDIMEYSLDGILYRRYGIIMDKTYQTSFQKDTPLIPEQVVYAALDVRYLEQLRNEQLLELHQKDLEFVAALENEAVIAFAEIHCNGMQLDTEAWRNNIALAMPLVAEARAECESLMLEDPVLNQRARELNYVVERDTPVINLNSPTQCLKMLQLAIPWLEGSSTGYLKGLLKRKTDLTPQEVTLITAWLDTTLRPKITEQFCIQYREQMIAMELFRPAGQITINWNSHLQVLPLFQAVKKNMKGLAKEDIAEFPHAIGISFSEYKDSLKLLSSYGEEFIIKHLYPDGRIHTNVSQILVTGRISTDNPNMQQIPAKEKVGNRYRNCFIPNRLSDVFVSSDYISQELVIIAELTREPVWLNALAKGEDLHSIMAELVYKDAWVKGTEGSCAYHRARQKCSCKVHKRLRSNIKTINFGLAYGMSKFKLAATLRIKVPQAERLMEEYFSKVPRIKGTLEYLGNFAVRNGYIHTVQPFFRKRWFPYWHRVTRNIEPHLRGVRYDGILGSIERAGKNQPIQGTSADITKAALVLIMNYLDEFPELRSKVFLVMQVHDQIDSQVERSYAEEWSKIQTRLMEDAARLCFPSGLLKAETQITEKWQK